MRLLVVTNLYPPHALGGYEYSCRDVVARLAGRGHEVHVLTTDTRLPAVADLPEPDVRRALRWYWRDSRLLSPPWRERLAVERHNRDVLQSALRDVRPDVVSVWAMGAMSLGLVDVLNGSGVPAGYVVCDEWPVYGPRLDAWTAGFRGRAGRVVAPIVRRVTGLPTRMPEPRDATVCWVSDFIRDVDLAATGWRPAHETVTYSGIDPDDFPLTRHSPADWRWRLLCVGRVEPRKGFATAVEALARLPGEATLHVAGPDQAGHTDALRRLAADLGVADRVTFGVTARERLREVYAAADAVLFPSAWREPFGLVPIEAMACGVPVVAAPTGGAAEFLADGANCLAVPAGDPGALAGGVRRLAADPALRRRLAAGGRATAADLTVDTLTDVLERWHAGAAARFADGEPPHRPPPHRPPPHPPGPVRACAPTPT